MKNILFAFHDPTIFPFRGLLVYKTCALKFALFSLSVEWPVQRGGSRRIHHVQPAAANKNKAAKKSIKNSKHFECK